MFSLTLSVAIFLLPLGSHPPLFAGDLVADETFATVEECAAQMQIDGPAMRDKIVSDLNEVYPRIALQVSVTATCRSDTKNNGI